MSYNHAMIRIHEPYRNDEPDEPDGHQAPDINDRQTNDSPLGVYAVPAMQYISGLFKPLLPGVYCTSGKPSLIFLYRM